jgi:carbon-monoxide dehydrogenase large subunit
MTDVAAPIGRLVGQSVKRVEDKRILTGRGHYVDDVVLPGMVHAAFVRSPLPHARIVSIDASRARALPGVVAVFTGDDVVEQAMMVDAPIPGYQRATYYPLARDKVRLVGDPVAIVVAVNRYVAEDARDLLDVEYEPLPPVATMEQARTSDTHVFDELGTNVIFEDRTEWGDPDAAFAGADRVVRETFTQQRFTNVPMETRGGVASYDPSVDELTYTASTQAPQALRMVIAGLLGLPAHRMRVLAGDVGGAFGLKVAVYREDVAICFASKQLGRPVKWIEDRAENLTASGQAREETLEVAAAVRNDGTIVGLDVSMTMDGGAYPAIPIPLPLFTTVIKVMIPSGLRLQNYRFAATIVTTNKGSYVPYRGPWAVETWIREGIIDKVARELGLEAHDVRRRNLVPMAEQPTKNASNLTLEGVTTIETLDRATELFDVPAFRVEQERARAEGRYLGLGFATFIEPAPGPPDYSAAVGMSGKEPAHARLEPDGHLTLFTSQAPHGQSHETTLAQVAADELGVPFDHVRVVHGDTRVIPFNFIGTGGSRAATMASGAAMHATRVVKEKVLELASSMLEISPSDLELVDGVVRPKGVPGKELPLAKIAAAAYFAPREGADVGLDGLSAFPEPRGGWSIATHACLVEIDAETGVIGIRRYLVVHDCGTMINPAVVEGQIRGGVAQGIGGALLEHTRYDEDGNLLTTTFMDYLVPTAMEIPEIEIEHIDSPPLAEVNFRGVGEGGAICAPAAVANAVSDALAPFGVSVNELPLTPTRVLELIGVL